MTEKVENAKQAEPVNPADVVEPLVKEEVPVDPEVAKEIEKKQVDITSWKPKTTLGLKVKNKEITSIDQVLDNGMNILEYQIVDALMPNLQTDLLMIGQSKGKFGGGARRVFRQTQKKTNEGNKPKFLTVAIIGNKNGYVGMGY